MCACDLVGCTIVAKAENLNPGGSVKDRAALYLIKDAEEKGKRNGRDVHNGEMNSMHQSQ